MTPQRVVSRRQLLLEAGVMGAAPLALQACSTGNADADYQALAQRTWRAAKSTTIDNGSLMRELVRYASLAPSSHNTQCWKFALEQRSIALLPDLSRRCPAVDPDDHHLFVSLGCAAENLVQAARAHGLMGEAALAHGPTDALRIALEPTKAVTSSLFEAISKRQCTRAEYDGKAISREELALLEHAGAGEGTRLLLLTDKSVMEQVLAYVIEGNTAQMQDAAFVAELKAWIRFGDAEAVRTADGLFSRCTGNPSVPRWLGSSLFPLLFRATSENDKYARQVRSSAGIAIFVSARNDKAHWIEAGRCYERFALQATALGIRNAFLNQPVEVSTLRPQFASFLGVGGLRPDLVLRFGRGPEMPRSLRRPIEAVLL